MPIDKKDPKYGIPQLKKFPLPDARHVRSAIRFFNYAPPRYERQLAAAILRHMKEYGLSFDDFTVGEENRFHKYIPKRQLDQAMAHAICIDNYGRLVYSDELWHHGILGQEWGVQNGPPYPLSDSAHSTSEKKADWKESLRKGNSGSSSESIGKAAVKKLSKAKCSNLDSWGKAPDKNVLYLTGYSGGGKSSIAKYLESKNVSVIHMDSYYDNPDGPRNKALDKYLDEHLPDHRKMTWPKDKISLNDWGKICEKFEQEVENFGAEQYKSGKKVICEGVQLLDDTFRPDKNYFKDKPVVTTTTSAITSNYRANKRDNYKYDDFRDLKAHVKWYATAHKELKDFNRISGAGKSKTGREYLNYR